ncbi:MAG: formylglycine-generating enzyme family protein [Bacteroidales bacterium]|nr:formylglycine-generating enzyme family protein [Bacteroidales bacterium]
MYTSTLQKLMMIINFKIKGLLLVILSLSLGLTQTFAQVPTIEMVYVRGGDFWMGCTGEQRADCSLNETPAHLVHQDDFLIAKYEVTQELWIAVMGGKNPSKVIGDSLPVTRITWYAAREFIQKLNKMTGKKFRLPTEAEWEYAARGGAESQGYMFSGSDNLNEVAWYRKNSGRKPQPVGTKKPNELGIYDMSGNVYEWCYDGFEYYDLSLNNTYNPYGDDWNNNKIFRGGCMTSFPDVCRVSARSQGYNTYQYNYVGFRLAMDVE